MKRRSILALILILAILPLGGCTKLEQMCKKLDHVEEYRGKETFDESFEKSFIYHDSDTPDQEIKEDGVTYRYASSQAVPRDFQNEDITGYYNRIVAHFPLGDSVQTWLAVTYSPQAFDKEVERLSQITGVEKIRYDETRFAYPAYVTALGWEWSEGLFCSEYVLVDKETYTLHYVYICRVKQEDLKLEPTYLPPGYTENGRVDGGGWTIFA